MIADAIRFVLTNVPAVMLVLAVLVAAIPRTGRPFAARLLDWVLLLPIGVTGIWAGAFHIAFPQMSAAYIGWEPSPFQFEVGMADLAFGITAVLSFWCSLDFRAAAIIAASVFLLGDAVGHVHQMLAAGNFAPGNAGVPFVTDIACPALAGALWWMERRRLRGTATAA
jgi:hypothetical protein